MKGLLGSMFLLMPMILVVGWLVLTWLLWKGGRRFLESKFANRAVRIGLVVTVAVIWLGFAFWEAGGKKLYWDAKVRELCAQDGGIKVYESVELPADQFDKYGNVHILPKDRAAPQDLYYYEREIQYLRNDNPKITRTHHVIIRRRDGKKLGESIRYGRGGGDLPGPWHPSSYTCPPITKDHIGIENLVFKKGGVK